MWNEVYVENSIRDHKRVISILQKLKKDPIIIGKYDEIWGRSKKPYLQKRDTLNIFLARKEGQLLKLAPDAYGSAGEPHYYFIHAYNCIYECQYCYLQGYFNTPDIVLFINHEEIISEMEKALQQHKGKVWFHAGEFSDEGLELGLCFFELIGLEALLVRFRLERQQRHVVRLEEEAVHRGLADVGLGCGADLRGRDRVQREGVQPGVRGRPRGVVEPGGTGWPACGPGLRERRCPPGRACRVRAAGRIRVRHS